MARVSRKRRKAESNTHGGGDAYCRYAAAVYTRLSVEDSRKKISDSIGAQRDLLMRYIDEHPDLVLYGIYEDINCTGTNFHRPAFARMIGDIQAGSVNCVVVKDLSRFGRSFEETGNYIERVLPFFGVRFISVGDNYDSLTASLDDSGLIIPLKNLMNELYARDISKKTRAGFEAKRKRGEFCGSIAPYGYIKSGPSLIVDDEAAAIVRRIFAWLLDGRSDKEIAQRLNSMNVLPPSRYRFKKGVTKAKKHAETQHWYKSAVKRISENPVYTGAIVLGKYKSNFLRGGGIIQTDKEKWVIIENTHPTIIDKEIFKAVAEIRESRGKAKVADE